MMKMIKRKLLQKFYKDLLLLSDLIDLEYSIIKMCFINCKNKFIKIFIILCLFDFRLGARRKHLSTL